MAKKKKQMRRFYQGKKEGVVWDPKRNVAYVEFQDRQFLTDDPNKIALLIELGYQEVSLTAKRPPDAGPDNEPEIKGDVPVLPQGMTEEAMLVRQKREALLDQGKGISAGSITGEEPAPKGKKKITRRKPK